MLELGCGTGRNLIAAAKAYPDVRFYGLDISRNMLETAQKNIDKAGLTDRITLVEGDAANPAATEGFGVPAFDRVFYSYTLSMIPIWREAWRQVPRGWRRTGGSTWSISVSRNACLPGSSACCCLAQILPRISASDLEHELKALAASIGAVASFHRLYAGYSDYAVISKSQ